MRWIGEGAGGSHLLPVEPDLEPVECFIRLEHKAAVVTQWVQVAMLHQEDAQVQGL